MAENLDKRIGRLSVASSEASVYMSSSEDFQFTCTSCKSRSGHFVEANGFCVECSEYLCQPCIQYHLANKTHVLLHLHQITDISDIKAGGKKQAQYSTKNISSSAVNLDHLTFLKDVNVKSGSDTNDCYITDIVVISDQLLAVADCDNTSVKVIDYRKDTERDYIQLKSGPLSMTLLPGDQLAVTLADIKCINIVATRPRLAVIQTIHLDGLCDDVVNFNGKLLVSFRDPLMFRVITLTGQAIDNVVPGPDVTSVCSIPSYIALSQDEKTIFISDCINKISLSMDMNGRKIAEYKQLEDPRGIVCSPQLPYIMVCDRYKHEIRKLTMNLQDDGILLNNSDGLWYPGALCFYSEQRLLLVSSLFTQQNRRNNIKLFKY